METRINYFKLLTIGVGVGIGLTACTNMKKEEGKHDQSEVKEEWKEAAKTTAAYAQEERNEMIMEMKARRDSIRKSIDSLESRAENLSDQSKKMMKERIARLREEQEKVSSNMKSFRNSTEASFEEIKAAIDSAFYELEAGIAEAKKEF